MDGTAPQDRLTPVGATLFDLLPVGAYQSSLDGRLLRANAALVRFNGCNSEADLLRHGQDATARWYVDAGQRQRFVDTLLREGQVVGFVSEVVRLATRERVWVTENAHVVRDADGSVRYFEGTIEEITDRVLAQRALERSEAHLRMITHHLPVSIYRLQVDPDGQRRYTFVSEGVRNIFGVEPEAVMADGTVLEQYRHPDDQAAVAEAIRQASLSGQPLTVEFRIISATGQHKWVQVMSIPVPSTESEAGQVRIGVLIDITEQKQATEMRLARDRAEAADRAKTQLLSRVSHELRTPLNAVLGFGQLLQTDPALSPRHLAWTRQIVASGEHLLALVDDMLDLASAQAERLALECAPVPLLAVLAESWDMLAMAARAAGVQCVDESAGHAPLWVQADARRLKQVLSNLLSNAIKYNRPGGHVRVQLLAPPTTVEAAPDPAAQAPMVQLRVADSGLGMSPAQLARLFEPFERLGAQRSTVPGTGLGLALSRQLVEAMGGRIEVQSQPQQGTVFTVFLRAAAAPG